MKRTALLLTVCLVPIFAQETFPAGAQADAEIDRAVADGLIPGAVLLIGHDGQVTYRKAYGWRALIPQREPMTVDTIFDAASLTKILATTSCLMKLFEQGRIRINDPVTHYLPEFQGGHSGITIRNLMTHFSGLRPDLDLAPAWSGYDAGIRRALTDKPAGPPGVEFVYSDINFILLGEIVHRLSGEPLSKYASEVVFGPLGMKDTMFLPPASLRPRIAPTEIDAATGQPIRGVVHDETSRFMGGVAGHAGVFTTADDMARFAQMMIDRGVLDGRPVFSPLAVEKFTTPQSPADQPILRGLGWDIDSPFSANRGELFAIGSYGHTGFTGTSLWIDPLSRTYVILLTNAVHPHRGKSITSLRSRIATIAAAAYGIASPLVQITGYDETIVGAGLHRKVNISNAGTYGARRARRAAFRAIARPARWPDHESDRRGPRRRPQYRCNARSRGGYPGAVFSRARHCGQQDQPDVANATDPSTGIRVWSLYRPDARRLTDPMLSGVDTVVFDIQDVGARFYTYSCTMVYAMEEAAKRHLRFVVLDRPNPVTGVHMEGPMLDKDLESFTGCVEMPLRHGMTLGEIANMVNGQRQLGLDLQVIRLSGLAARILVRFIRPPLDKSLAEHAQPECGAALSGSGDARGVAKLLRWTRHRCPVRTDRRRLDQRT